MTTKVQGSNGVEFPDATVQSSAALTAFIGANQSLSPNGYQKLPGGLIVQWGRDSGGAGDHEVVFPIPFPTALLSVVASANSPTAVPANAAVVVMTTVATLPLTRFFAQPRYSNNGPQLIASEPFYWIAIGY